MCEVTDLLSVRIQILCAVRPKRTGMCLYACTCSIFLSHGGCTDSIFLSRGGCTDSIFHAVEAVQILFS